MSSHENNDVLLASGFSISQFRDLPRTHQLALVHYLALDGEAWEWPAAMETEFQNWISENKGITNERQDAALRRIMVDHIDDFVMVHGDMEIGVAVVDMKVVKQHVLSVDPDIGDHGSWDAYHTWYTSGGGVPSYSDSDRWPCVLSGMDNEAFEDGWHRLHSYAAAGHADLPVIFFPDERHFDHEARMDIAPRAAHP